MTNNVFQILNRFLPNMQGLQDVKSPDELAQKLLNSGRINQAQVNQAKQMWSQPNVRQFIQNRFKFFLFGA